MIYLILSIISTTCLVLIFKLFEKFKIDTFQAIVVNYIVAAGLGFLLDDSGIAIGSITSQGWFFNAVIIGVLFIPLFNIIAITAQKIGIAVASVAGKMSLIIPVVFAVYLYDDSMSLIKITGIILALAGVYLTFMKSEKDIRGNKLVILPIIIFLTSGLLDTLYKYTEHNYLSENDMSMFVTTLFTIAAISGIIAIIIRKQLMNIQLEGSSKNILWGIVLGIPNYGSMFFLMKTLEIENFESSVIFPVNNIGIVGLSAIAALVIFKERMTMINWLGIAISIIAIVMIAF